MKYKINLHAHTIFSDGSNTPLGMALEAKKLGFSALCITDHYYGPNPERTNWRLDKRKMKLLRRACLEAKKILPVIIGIELAFGKEEMLVFGSALINRIIQHREEGRELSVELLKKWKHSLNGVFILCHPQLYENWEYLKPILDGYEKYNSGQDMFPDNFDNIGLEILQGLPEWCNSDAHADKTLKLGYNIVDMKIKNENDLIKYIRKGKQPEFVVYDRNKNE